MLSKNNRGLRLQKYSDRKQRFTIKRFSVGVASVLIGTAFMMYGSASADQVSSLKSGEASSVVTQDNNQINSGSETGNPEATSTETSTVTKETPSVNSTQEETSVDSVSQDTETSVTTKEVSSQNASEESTFTQLNTKQLSTSVDTSATDEVATNQLSASLLATTPTLVATGNRSMGTTDTGAVKNYTFDNLAFNFDNLSDASVKAGNDINFRISIYQKGANSGSNWQIRLQLDSTIAEQVSSIKAHPVNRPDKWVYFERQAGTNIWAAPYIRANGGIFGGADLGAYTVDGVIELKDTVGNVIANDNNNIPYRAYVYDQHNQAPISSSITEGYFNTLPEPQISNDTTRLNKFKKLSASSQVRFDPTVGEYGAFIVDETILKNGTLALVMQYNLDDTQYHINIDPELVDKFENPEYYIGRYDFGGPGFIPTYFEEDYRATTSFNDQGQAYFDIPDATASLGNTTSKKEYLNVNGAQNPIIVRTVLKLKQSAYDLMTTDASGEPVFLIPKDSAILPVELYFSDNNGGMFPTTYTTGGLLAQELPTNVDANVKPVLPTGDKQDTGIKVEYATDKTTITATDANGNDVPVEKDEKTGEVYVSTKGAKGPIKVTVSDPSMITNVDGVKTGEFTADVPVVVIPEKTPVANVSELTDKEKREVENKVKEANKDVFPDPDNTAVTVENDGTATITYPDKSTQTIPGSDLVRLAPQGKDVTVEKGKTPEAKQGIANEKDLPKGTTYEWKTPVDTSTPGETEGTVEVTYPDGTKDEVPVKVHVTDPRTDADKNDPKGQDINVNVNDEPKAEDGISNKDDMPSGTKYEWKDGQTPDTTTPGIKEGTIKVTYPDGTKEEVPVKVHVTDPRTDADKNDPKGQDINVNVGDEPKAEDGISNKDDMPSGTKYEWKDGQTPDTTTPGIKEGTIKVTYPDGTKEEVPVKVHVTDPRTDADKNDPKGQDINVNVNDEPKAEDGISNKDDMPSGTKYEWKDGQTPDTTTPGIKEGTIEVTYPDGTKEEVPVKVNVIEQSVPGDAPSYDLPSLPITDVITPLIPDKTPVHDTTSLTDGEKEEVTGKVTEVNNFPDGTKVEVDNDGTATITYPDGSQDTIPGTDLVTETVTESGQDGSQNIIPGTDSEVETPTSSTKAGTSDKVVINVANKPVVQPEEKAKVAVNASKELPQTGETHADESTLGLVALAAAGVLSFMGLGKKRED